jgi:hypothetical protein
VIIVGVASVRCALKSLLMVVFVSGSFDNQQFCFDGRFEEFVMELWPLLF